MGNGEYGERAVLYVGFLWIGNDPGETQFSFFVCLLRGFV
jgi:hypothetical protein